MFVPDFALVSTNMTPSSEALCAPSCVDTALFYITFHLSKHAIKRSRDGEMERWRDQEIKRWRDEEKKSEEEEGGEEEKKG